MLPPTPASPTTSKFLISPALSASRKHHTVRAWLAGRSSRRETPGPLSRRQLRWLPWVCVGLIQLPSKLSRGAVATLVNVRKISVAWQGCGCFSSARTMTDSVSCSGKKKGGKKPGRAQSEAEECANMNEGILKTHLVIHGVFRLAFVIHTISYDSKGSKPGTQTPSMSCNNNGLNSRWPWTREEVNMTKNWLNSNRHLYLPRYIFWFFFLKKKDLQSCSRLSLRQLLQVDHQRCERASFAPQHCCDHTVERSLSRSLSSHPHSRSQLRRVAGLHPSCLWAKDRSSALARRWTG